MGPIQQLLLSEREDGLQAGGCLLAEEVIRSVPFDYLRIITLSIFLRYSQSVKLRFRTPSFFGTHQWFVSINVPNSETLDVGRDDDLGSPRNRCE